MLWGRRLVQVEWQDKLTLLAEGLDRSTLLEIINNTAAVVTLGGQIWTIDNLAGPPFGRPLNSRVVTFESIGLVLSPMRLERLWQTAAYE